MRVHHGDNSFTLLSRVSKPCHVMDSGGGRVVVKFLDEI